MPSTELLGASNASPWDETLSTEENARAFMEHLRGEVLATRDGKFRGYFRKMEIAMRLARMCYGNERRKFLRMYYTIMRYLDDLIDGDLPVPDTYPSAVAAIEDALAFTQSSREGRAVKPVNTVQHLLAYCFDLGSSFQRDFHGETTDILSSLLFDGRRRADMRTTGHVRFFPERELQRYFYQCDVSGTICASLKAADEDVQLAPAFEPLGNVVRIYYNLRDFTQDVRAGLVNISQEDTERLGITEQDLSRGYAHPSIRTWWNEQVTRGMQLLEEHRKQIRALPLHGMTRAVLVHAYEKPARRFFEEQRARKTIVLPRSPEGAFLQAPVNNSLTMARATILSLMHQHELGIEPMEQQRYMQKSRNLALCYRGLSSSTGPTISVRAAIAGFLSCTYDVTTDWRAFDVKSRAAFERILRKYANPQATQLVLDLYEKDKTGELEHDGLERGSVSMQFIAMIMNIRQELEEKGIALNELGELLQIVDDILDLEEDARDGQANCLLAPCREQYLQKFLESNIATIFPRTLLQQVILRARLEARLLLRPQK